MRFTPRKPRGGEHDFFDLTPMIDVVMQLIIFFMFTSQFAQVVRSQIDLPEEPGEAETVESEEALIIDVQTDGSLIVAGQPIARDKLVGMIAAELAARGNNASQLRVLVRADRAARSTHINAIAEELARLGVRGWRLGTSRPPDAPPAGNKSGGGGR